MRTSLMILALSLSACGAASTSNSQLADDNSPGTTTYIKPLGINTSCLNQANERTRVTDHRVSPPRTYYTYRSAMTTCDYSAATDIKYLNGNRWTGTNGQVYILNRALGL